MWYVTSSSGPLPSLFKLCSWGLKWPIPEVTFYEGLVLRRHKKIFLSESKRLRALIFCMLHHLALFKGPAILRGTFILDKVHFLCICIYIN